MAYNAEVIISGSDSKLGRPVKLRNAYGYEPWKDRQGVLGKVVREDITYHVGDKVTATVNAPLKQYAIVFKDAEGNVECAIPVNSADFLYLDVYNGTKDYPFNCGAMVTGTGSRGVYYKLKEPGTFSIVGDVYGAADTVKLYYSKTEPSGAEVLYGIHDFGEITGTFSKTFLHDGSISDTVLVRMNYGFEGSSWEVAVTCTHHS